VACWKGFTRQIQQESAANLHAELATHQTTRIFALDDASVNMELPVLTQFIANISVAVDAGYDTNVAEIRAHIERGDIISFLTDMCYADPVLMAKLVREHWETETGNELTELLRDESGDEKLAGSFNRSGMCYLIALTTRLIKRCCFGA